MFHLNPNTNQTNERLTPEIMKRLKELCAKGYLSPFLLNKFIQLQTWRKQNGER